MKIPLKYQQLEDLDYTLYQNKFKASVKKMKNIANSPETAVSVFINQEYTFANDIKEVMILFGNQNGPWKKWTRDSVKANKKMTMIGKGYIQTEDGGMDVFKFVSEKGAAKIPKVKKAAKQLLKKGKITLMLVDSLAENISAEEQALFTDTEENTDVKNPPVETVDPRVLIKEIAATQLDIKNQYSEFKKYKEAGYKDGQKSVMCMLFYKKDLLVKQIEELRSTKINEKQMIVFDKNLAGLNNLLKNFSGYIKYIEKTESKLDTLVDEVNTLIKEFGVNQGFKISHSK